MIGVHFADDGQSTARRFQLADRGTQFSPGKKTRTVIREGLRHLARTDVQLNLAVGCQGRRLPNKEWWRSAGLDRARTTSVRRDQHQRVQTSAVDASHQTLLGGSCPGQMQTSAHRNERLLFHGS